MQPLLWPESHLVMKCCVPEYLIYPCPLALMNILPQLFLPILFAGFMYIILHFMRTIGMMLLRLGLLKVRATLLIMISLIMEIWLYFVIN